MCTYVSAFPEVGGSECGGLLEGEKCDPDCPEVWKTAEELHWRALFFMGAFEALTISSHRLCRWYLTGAPGRLSSWKTAWHATKMAGLFTMKHG
jgi:hypothetical protein